MSTFAWLIVGHLLGDWLLQNDWMARQKRVRLCSLAGFVHFSIYTAVILWALWLSGAGVRSAWFYVAAGTALLLSHWLLDATPLVDWWMQAYRQSKVPFVRVMGDQTLHIVVLAALAALA